MLNAVLFDLDNTLINRDEAFRQCVYAHFHDAGVRSEIVRVDQGGYGQRNALFRLWGKHAGKAMSQLLLGKLIAERLQPDRSLLDALHSLSRRFKLGIITNGGGETQRRKFRAAGFGQVIPSEHLWVSDDLGTAKPDPAIFLFASRALGLPPSNCLYIGDREEEDMAGATGAGMRAQLVHTVLNGERLEDLMRREQLQ